MYERWGWKHTCSKISIWLWVFLDIFWCQHDQWTQKQKIWQWPWQFLQWNSLKFGEVNSDDKYFTFLPASHWFIWLTNWFCSSAEWSGFFHPDPSYSTDWSEIVQHSAESSKAIWDFSWMCFLDLLCTL